MAGIKYQPPPARSRSLGDWSRHAVWPFVFLGGNIGNRPKRQAGRNRIDHLRRIGDVLQKLLVSLNASCDALFRQRGFQADILRCDQECAVRYPSFGIASKPDHSKRRLAKSHLVAGFDQQAVEVDARREAKRGELASGMLCVAGQDTDGRRPLRRLAKVRARHSRRGDSLIVEQSRACEGLTRMAGANLRQPISLDDFWVLSIAINWVMNSCAAATPCDALRGSEFVGNASVAFR